MAEGAGKLQSQSNVDGTRDAGSKPGQKRPYVSEDRPPAGPSARQPPWKKPKKDRGSIFIPKKNKS